MHALRGKRQLDAVSGMYACHLHIYVTFHKKGLQYTAQIFSRGYYIYSCVLDFDYMDELMSATNAAMMDTKQGICIKGVCLYDHAKSNSTKA